MKIMIQYLIVLLALVHASIVWTQDAGAGNGQTLPNTDAYTNGLLAEERELDYAKAAEHYRSVIQEFDAQRSKAAHAIFRLGECLLRMDRLEEAKVQYDRILRDFSDINELVEQSQVKLDAFQSFKREGKIDASANLGVSSVTPFDTVRRIHKFLEDLEIHLGITSQSKYTTPGIWVTKGHFEIYHQIVNRIYRQGTLDPSEFLIKNLARWNDLGNIEVSDFRSEMLKKDKMFLPLLPEFFTESLSKKWSEAGINLPPQELPKLRFKILGQVQNPGFYEVPFDKGLDLLDGIAIAGGFTDNAGKITVKKVDGSVESFSKRLLLQASAKEILKLAGDETIIVGESFF